MPAGRPTKYKKEFCQVLIDEMTEGAAIEEVAGTLGIVKSTLYKWGEKHEEFSDAIKEGKALSESWWMRMGRTNMYTKEFNASLWYMNMKNRHKWRDRQDITSNDKDVVGVINITTT